MNSVSITAGSMPTPSSTTPIRARSGPPAAPGSRARRTRTAPPAREYLIALPTTFATARSSELASPTAHSSSSPASRVSRTPRPRACGISSSSALSTTASSSTSTKPSGLERVGARDVQQVVHHREAPPDVRGDPARVPAPPAAASLATRRAPRRFARRRHDARRRRAVGDRCVPVAPSGLALDEVERRDQRRAQVVGEVVDELGAGALHAPDLADVGDARAHEPLGERVPDGGELHDDLVPGTLAHDPPRLALEQQRVEARARLGIGVRVVAERGEEVGERRRAAQPRHEPARHGVDAHGLADRAPDRVAERRGDEQRLAEGLDAGEPVELAGQPERVRLQPLHAARERRRALAGAHARQRVDVAGEPLGEGRVLDAQTDLEPARHPVAARADRAAPSPAVAAPVVRRGGHGQPAGEASPARGDAPALEREVARGVLEERREPLVGIPPALRQLALEPGALGLQEAVHERQPVTAPDEPAGERRDARTHRRAPQVRRRVERRARRDRQRRPRQRHGEPEPGRRPRVPDQQQGQHQRRRREPGPRGRGDDEAAVGQRRVDRRVRLDARERPVECRDRRRHRVPEPLRGQAQQHRASGDRLRRRAPGDEVRDRDPLERARRAVVRDHDLEVRRVAPPARAARAALHRTTRRVRGGRRAERLVRGQPEDRPVRAPDARLQVGPAHDAVVVDRQRDVAERVRRAGHDGDRQPVRRRAPRPVLEQHRQHRDGQRLERFRQARVAAALVRALGVDDVDEHGARPEPGDLADDDALQVARPRPAAELGEARVVDRRDDDVLRRGARVEAHPGVVHEPVDATRGVGPVEHLHEPEQRDEEAREPGERDESPAALAALRRERRLRTRARAPRAGSRAGRSTSASSARTRAAGASS